jgi:hypothetical protein
MCKTGQFPESVGRARKMGKSRDGNISKCPALKRIDYRGLFRSAKALLPLLKQVAATWVPRLCREERGAFSAKLQARLNREPLRKMAGGSAEDEASRPLLTHLRRVWVRKPLCGGFAVA